MPPRRPASPGALDPQRPTPELLRLAYAQGAFPMADPDDGRIDWWSPDPRAILPLEAFHCPRSLARVVRSGRFEIRSDTAFETVMRACAEPRPGQEGGEDTWISEGLVAAYVALHEAGDAHSVEAWRDGVLVGGLYGVHLGGAFFGESMFSRPAAGGRDASKACLVRLVEAMRAGGLVLLDTQFITPHLARFGAVEIPRRAYLRRLAAALAVDGRWTLGAPPAAAPRTRAER